MPLDTRDYVGLAADIEKNLGKAQAQARVLSFTLRNRQTDNVSRTAAELTNTLDSAISVLKEMLRDMLADLERVQ